MPSYTSSIMEEGGHYVGNATGGSVHGFEDAHSASNAFALDFAGMLDAADSVFHQQIYEYLQGPALHQQTDYHHRHLQDVFVSSSLDSQGAGFPAQAQHMTYNHPVPPITSTSSLPAALTSTSQKVFAAKDVSQPLRSAGHVTSFVDTSSPPHLSVSRRDDHSSPFESQRKEQQSMAPAAAGIESTSAGMGITAHWNGAGSCGAISAPMTYSADVLFYPSVHAQLEREQQQQPSLVPDGRELSSFETSSSPDNHLKRSSSSGGGGKEPEGLISPRGRGRKAAKIEPAAAKEDQFVVKLQRPAAQAEHIIRERQRRDDMASKYLILESLLPPGPKRDRTTVVEDSILYVKSLHHRVKELRVKRSEVQWNHTISSHSPTLDTLKQRKCSVRSNMVGNHQVVVVKAITSLNDQTNGQLAIMSPSGSSAIEKIEVHLDLPHQIVIEMTCRPHRYIQSQIMMALERLGTDMSRCSISKLHNRLICVIAVKPRQMTQPLLTDESVKRALMRAIVPY